MATTIGMKRSQTVKHSGKRADFLAFLQCWCRSPAAVGLPFESSQWAAQRLAQTTLETASLDEGPILELGAGTGSVTQALADLGCPFEQIVVVERDAQLCRLLRKRFKGLRVLSGDALQLGKLLETENIRSVRTVLSGLPMRAIPFGLAIGCYSQAFQLMPNGGAIVQYTYGLQPPVDLQASGLNLEAMFMGREWRNFPPIGIWKYRLVS